MKIVVASENPVKLEAARQGFARMFPKADLEMIACSVPSDVSDQPDSDRETLSGALNRAQNASRLLPEADYWVGIEGGVEERGADIEAFAWMVVLNRAGKVGKGRAGTFFLPPKVAALVRQGMELGAADDVVFGKRNSKHQGGSVGLLTHEVSNRTLYYVEALILALIPFKNPELYP